MESGGLGFNLFGFFSGNFGLGVTARNYARLLREAGQRVAGVLVHGGMDRLDQRALAHAACAPQQRVVGGQAAGEALCIVDQQITHTVDSAQQFQRQPVDRSDRQKMAGVGDPHESVGGAKIGLGRQWRGEALKGGCDSLDERRLA